MAMRHLQTLVALVLAVSIALTSAESIVDDHAALEASPKMQTTIADVEAFIQEEVSVRDTCDCQPAVTKAYGKFRGDMKKIESLKEQCDVRANKAETKSKKMREAIAKETSVESSQYNEKAQELAKQCTEKIALARKDEAAKAGGSVDAAVQKEQMRMKGEIEKFAAKKAEFELKAKRMQMKLKVELTNVQKKVQSAEEKQLQSETALKKAQRELKDQKAKLERQAILSKQKLEAIKAQLAAKTKECESAKGAVDVARLQAKKSSEGTTHAQLEAKAAETAEKVQVVKLKNSLDMETEKEKAVESALQKDKAKLGKEGVELNAALRKDQRLEAANNVEKQNTQMANNKLKDLDSTAKRDREKARSEEKSLENDKNKAKEELAGTKAKAVAQEAKDAIAEGQTKGQLTVVLGKLKANQLAKEKDGYKARLVAKGRIADKQQAVSTTEIKVCMARSIGYQKQIAACIGAEKALKREELSVQALGKLSKEKITQRLRMRRKQLAVCKAKSDGLERHLQDKMVLQTKLESTERVLDEWKKTGKALQTQVHRLTMQRNSELLKQQRLAMSLP